MTTIYFIRHAESDFSIKDDRSSPLTAKGLINSALVSEFLQSKRIDVILSSPYKRAVDTIAGFAESSGLPIHTVEDFREREGAILDNWRPNAEKQWADFSYKLPGNESLADVRERNITALSDVLIQYRNKNVVIGTHGIALSTIINFYDKNYGFNEFMEMVFITPWLVIMDFDENGCVGMKKVDLFQPYQEPDYGCGKVIISSLGDLKAYRFVVIFSRYQDKWLYCRIKGSDTYGPAGGHIECGETPIEAATRELFEETGALKYTITPVFDYSVHIPTEYSNGQVFLAHIQKLGELPDSEMAEVKLFDTIPDKMRFQQILPVLYERIQQC